MQIEKVRFNNINLSKIEKATKKKVRFKKLNVKSLKKKKISSVFLSQITAQSDGFHAQLMTVNRPVTLSPLFYYYLGLNKGPILILNKS